MRRYSPLFAVFVLSGLLTGAGFAGASANPDADAHATPEQRDADVHVALPASVERLLIDTHLAAPMQPSWSTSVDERLAALRPITHDTGHAPDKRLRTRIEDAIATLGDHARVAIEVRDLDSGAVLFRHDSERTLNPASNQKLITAIAAVELLGPDYRFATTVSRDGDALVLRGEGDPDLHVGDLHRLVTTLSRAPEQLAGVRRIVIDDSAFDSQQLGPGFRSDGPGDSYIAPSGALALDYGTVAITVTPGAHGQAAHVHVEPAGRAIEIRNHSHTGAGSISVTTHAGEQGRTIVEVSGSIPGGHAPMLIRRRVTDPGLVAGTCFAELLATQLGASPLPVSRGEVSPDAELLARHDSAPLLSVLGSALRYSNNFTAEQVLRTLAWRASGEPGSWVAGVDVLERFARAVSPTRADEQQFVNGSGLSLEGRLSAAFILDVLSLTTRPGSPSHMLLASFASSGGEGTLRHRLPHAGSQVLAKTGTYAGASTLSGVVQDDRRRLGFSILINGVAIERSRASQDRIVAALLRAL